MAKQDFLRAQDRYHVRWAPKPKTVMVGEIAVPMPIIPEDKFIKNIDLKASKQKYVREVVPEDIARWKQREIDEFVEAQWHRRRHGEWIMINDNPYYIPGPAIPFFDFWKLESGRPAEFRYSALTLFWLFYNYVEPDPNIFGIYDLKTRRIGDTANFIYMMWERCSRFRGVRGGLQSYNDTIAGKTFRRLAKGARNMPFFFKPNRVGSDKEYIAWMSQSELTTVKKLKDEKDIIAAGPDDREFIGSFIDYQPTTTGAYDGEQMFMSLLDEILKIPQFRMDAKAQWNNLRRCLSLHGEDFIYGKGFASSTVEPNEKKTAKANEDNISTIEIAQWFWDNSDPAMLTESPDGRTVSGLVRIFRGYQMAAKPDEFGFPQTERAREFRAKKIEKALKYGEEDMIQDIFRKEPAEAAEALMEDSRNCPLYPEICTLRSMQIDKGLDRYGEPVPNYRHPIVEGVLKWQNGIPNTKVEFIPTKNGPWHLSQQPMFPNVIDIRPVQMRDEYGNKITTQAYVPRYGGFYRAGCDPISSNPAIVTRGSKGAIVIKRRLYMPHEEHKLEINEFNVITNPELMVTNQVVADYIDRPRDPEIFFREVVKACWYFSTPVMIEMDKPELYVYLRKNGYMGMVMYEPPDIAQMRSNRKKNSPVPGVRSRGDIVGTYVTRLQTYISNYWPVIKHPRLLKQAARFVPAKRTKFDAAVAWGMAELGDMDTRYTLPHSETQTSGAWATNPYAV